MNIENLVICDWQTKGNVVRLYCCDQDKYDDAWGDDWSDRPYEHNAGSPYDSTYEKEDENEKGKILWKKKTMS